MKGFKNQTLMNNEMKYLFSTGVQGIQRDCKKFSYSIQICTLLLKLHGFRSYSSFWLTSFPIFTSLRHLVWLRKATRHKNCTVWDSSQNLCDPIGWVVQHR